MTIELLHKVDGNETKKIFKNVWEIQDNCDDAITIKYHNHLCERFDFKDIKELKIYRGV